MPLDPESLPADQTIPAQPAFPPPPAPTVTRIDPFADDVPPASAPAVDASAVDVPEAMLPADVDPSPAPPSSAVPIAPEREGTPRLENAFPTEPSEVPAESDAFDDLQNLFELDEARLPQFRAVGHEEAALPVRRSDPTAAGQTSGDGRLRLTIGPRRPTPFSQADRTPLKTDEPGLRRANERGHDSRASGWIGGRSHPVLVRAASTPRTAQARPRQYLAL